MYPADGRKLPDVWTHPSNLRDALQETLGQFPLFKFWGPFANIESSRWITSAAKWVEKRESPTLSLVYLPHLDYVLQKEGPKSTATLPEELQQIDALVGELIDFYSGRGVEVVVLSEYGIAAVDTPVHINRILREDGYVAIRRERGADLLDVGASQAFAVADHQVAHVYVRDAADVAPVRRQLEKTPGVGRVLQGEERGPLDHARSGELVCLAEQGRWFTYYFWLDDAAAPDYARTVDIHRKPGYDPCELFLADGAKPRLMAKLAARKLGFRNLLDGTPLDATLVHGSHGLADFEPEDGPLLLSAHPSAPTLTSTDIRTWLLSRIFGD